MRQLRRHRTVGFLGITVFFLSCGGVDPRGAKVYAGGAPQRPNLVFILADDLDEIVTTDEYLREVMPFTLSLRDEGARLVNHFSATICCEARAGLLTGTYAHNNGVFTNAGAYGGYGAFRKPLGVDGKPLADASGPIDNETRTFAKILSDAGYRTLLVGKYLNGFQADAAGAPPAPPIGWTDGHIAIDHQFYEGYGYKLLDFSKESPTGTVSSYGDRESDYSTDVVSNLAVRFIAESAAKRPDTPFLMYLASTAPHFPLPAAKRHAVKAARWIGSLPTSRPNFYADGDTVADKPDWLVRTWAKRGGVSERLWTRQDWFHRLGSLYALDEMVKSVFQSLKRSGKLDDTILVFASDNGYNLGAHRLNHKMVPYEESIRVPGFFWAGKNIGIGGRKTVREMTQHIDLAPTLLELAGLEIPTWMDGRSLLPLLKGTAVPWRRDFLTEYVGGSAADSSALLTEIPARLARYFEFYGLPSLLLDIPSFAMVRGALAVLDRGTLVQKEFAYVEWFEKGTARPSDTELYDLTRDPAQLDNLGFFRPAGCRAVIEAMQTRLKALRSCRGSACFTESVSASRAPVEASQCRRP